MKKLIEFYYVKEKLKAMLQNFEENMKDSNLAEDLLFKLEECEKGACLEQVKKKNLPLI